MTGSHSKANEWTTDMLDAMQQLLVGDGEFDRPFLNKLFTCLESFGGDELLSQVRRKLLTS